MKLVFLNIFALALFTTASSASAYQLVKSSGGGACTQDRSTCNVYCDNGYLAGSMNWNGSVWTDGMKWDPDKDAEARKIVAASGTACK
jgi:hypothetical protein